MRLPSFNKQHKKMFITGKIKLYVICRLNKCRQ